MNILFLNRRDVKNPDGGGAEVYTHEIAKGLVQKYNCAVSVFTSLFKQAEKEEVIDGVRYIRKGSELTVHLHGFLYAQRHRKEFDLIIDEFNGIGFFTSCLSNSILLIHQLYKEFWFRQLGIFGILPYILEPVILKHYKNKLAITVSDSTKKDLSELGFKHIQIVMNGLKPMTLPRLPEKKSVPVLVFLGRLKPTKKPEDAIEIFKKVKDKMGNAELWIIGSGSEENRLRQMAEKIGGITFWGHVDDKKKMTLLAEAQVLLVPGVREGFGINVIEAASAGTPAVGYNIPGLKDSIIHGETGFLVNDASEAAVKISELSANDIFYQKISENCLNYAKAFSWDKRVEEFWQKIRPD